MYISLVKTIVIFVSITLLMVEGKSINKVSQIDMTGLNELLTNNKKLCERCSNDIKCMLFCGIGSVCEAGRCRERMMSNGFPAK